MQIKGTLYHNIQPNVRNNYIIGHTLSDYKNYLDSYYRVREIDISNYNAMEQNELSFEITNLNVDINTLTYFYVEYTNNNNIIDYRFYHINNAKILSGKVVCSLSVDMFATNYFRTDIKCIAIASNKIIPNKNYYLNDNNNLTNRRYKKHIKDSQFLGYAPMKINTLYYELSKNNEIGTLLPQDEQLSENDAYFVMFANIPSTYSQAVNLGNQEDPTINNSVLTRQQVCLSIKVSDIRKACDTILRVGTDNNPIKIRDGFNIRTEINTLVLESIYLTNYLSNKFLNTNGNILSLKDCIDVLTNLYYCKLNKINDTTCSLITKTRQVGQDEYKTRPNVISQDSEVSNLILTQISSNSDLYLIPSYLLPKELTYTGSIYENDDEELSTNGNRVIFAVDSVKCCNYLIMKLCDLNENLQNITKYEIDSNSFSINDRLSFGTNNERVVIPYKSDLNIKVITTLNRNGITIYLTDDNSITKDITSAFKTNAPFQTAMYDNTAETRRQYALATAFNNYGINQNQKVIDRANNRNNIADNIANMFNISLTNPLDIISKWGNSLTNLSMHPYTKANKQTQRYQSDLDFQYTKEMSKYINYGYTDGVSGINNNDCYSTYSYFSQINNSIDVNLMHPLYFFIETTRGNFANNVFLEGANYESKNLDNNGLCDLANYDYILNCNFYSNYDITLPNTTKHLNYIKGEAVINNSQVEIQQYFTDLFNNGFLYYVL